MMSPSNLKHKPDAVGLAVARVAQQAAEPDTVILFGSRARGDHRENSDVDLLIIYKDNFISPYAGAQKAVREYLKQNPPELTVNIIPISRDKFDHGRRAPNHLAGQALRDGIIMSEDKLDQPPQPGDGYPDYWPDVKERLDLTYRNLEAFDYLLEGLSHQTEIYGFMGQQAIENALKAWISAVGLEYRTAHDLTILANTILSDREQAGTPAADQLRHLLDYITVPDLQNPAQDVNWLTLYAVRYRYSAYNHEMDQPARTRFHDEIHQAAEAIIDHVYRITGTGPDDLLS
jgi:predicted nucleotidyltransferase